MQKTAEFVSLGHPDKTADYISSYILDRMMEQDDNVRYAVEVMIKGNTVVLGGEICGNVSLDNVAEYVRKALHDIGYTKRYSKIWGDDAINTDKLEVLNFVGCQSPEILQGVKSGGWGDQGVFAGYACRGKNNIPEELYLARKLNRALYEKALNSDNLGLDIKTQITLDEKQNVLTAVIAVPMKKKEDLSMLTEEVLQTRPQNLIINGTGLYTCHSSIADCGVTGRKLACDFYSLACPAGGGSPWGKDASKADVSLNVLARTLAVKHLKDNDEAFVYLSSCIGRSELPSAVLKTVKGGNAEIKNLGGDFSPSTVIPALGLNKPVFAGLCRRGITG